ncbi:unnamed protein product [marine sediment metagenome]|uniref:Uncharacterized protein n=1 Tax=marine sediment metagenome TaxID=412755 RepID=X1ANQ6_9ZZZZ
MCVKKEEKTWESFRRTLVKTLSYRVIHYIIHLLEAYLVIGFYPKYGHMGPILIVALMQVICTIHYVLHERIFARVKWGYKMKEDDKATRS